MASQLFSDSQSALIRRGLTRSLKPGRLHFSAHSHHPWPDATESAHAQYWQDSTELLDSKWGKIFGTVIPESRSHLAKLLGLSDPSRLIEGTNTFELVYRVLSSFDPRKPLRILTTDSEFYSFERLSRRLSELEGVTIDRISTQPFENFEERMADQLKQTTYDVVFSSLVFFNSGFYATRLLDTLNANLPADTTVIIDLYHALGAVPVDLGKYATRFFLTGGGYKYLTAGEGACFLSVPDHCSLRPVMTGWMAEYHALEGGLSEQVRYAENGARFAGATYDPSAWYRMNAVQNWWREIGLTPENIHAHVRALQDYFLEKSGRPAKGYSTRTDWGNFLAIGSPQAQATVDVLRAQEIFVDARDGYLRVGFGYYHTTADVDAFIVALNKTAL